MSRIQTYAAIILAAGSGSRAQSKAPKQYVKINNRFLLEYSLGSFLKSGIFNQIILVIAPQNEALCRSAIKPELHGKIQIISGANSRQASTWQALLALAANAPDYVFIHDSARPFVCTEQLHALQQNLKPNQGAALALPLSDSIKRANSEGFIVENLDRTELYAAQTPQAFPFAAIFKAHQQASVTQPDCFTDDCALASHYGLPVKLLAGSANNIKITWPQDFEIAEYLAKKYSEEK